MNFDDLRKAKQDELIFGFSPKKDDFANCGFIGYLRGDFDSNGTGFFTSWFDGFAQLNTDHFKQNIDNTINYLRTGILCNRERMKTFCNNDEQKETYRFDALDYSYIIRCKPMKCDYDFYCCCYEKEKLDKYISNMAIQRFFFTYGTDDKFPFKRGFTVIEAKSITEACSIFRTIHKDVHIGILNCADYYTEETFREKFTNNESLLNFDVGMHEYYNYDGEEVSRSIDINKGNVEIFKTDEQCNNTINRRPMKR